MGSWKTIKGNHVYIEDGQSVEEALENQKRFAKSPVVQNGPDEVTDYLYEETGREEVSQSEIDDYIFNDLLDDDFSDYRDQVTQGELEACYKEIERRGYKINYDKKKPQETPKKAPKKKDEYLEKIKNSEKEYAKKRKALLDELKEETDMYAYQEIENGNYTNEELKEELEELRRWNRGGWK